MSTSRKEQGRRAGVIWWLLGSLDGNLIIESADLKGATEQEVGLDDASI